MHEVRFREYRAGDRDWVVSAHIEHYQRVERFDSEFDAVVIRAMEDLERRSHDRRNDYIVAEADNGNVGCVFFSAESEATGRIRLFYLTEERRGRGIGRQMLKRVLRGAASNGFETIGVSTFDRHEAACALYSSLGFVIKDAEPVLAFGHRMRRLNFERDLRSRSS